MRTFTACGDPALMAVLPPLPARDWGGGDAYDWADQLVGWSLVYSWGEAELDMGAWPHIMVAFCGPIPVGDGRRAFAVVTQTEGDIAVQVFGSVVELITALDLQAHTLWRRAHEIEGEPLDGVPRIGPLEARFHGPGDPVARTAWRVLLGIGDGEGPR